MFVCISISLSLMLIRLVKIMGRSLTTLNKFCPLLTTYLHWHCWINFFTVTRKNMHVIDISSTTTYLPHLVNIVCERPLTGKRSRKMNISKKTFRKTSIVQLVPPTAVTRIWPATALYCQKQILYDKAIVSNKKRILQGLEQSKMMAL